uniref:Ig-like domain-containing protein n=1 Tax=Clostridia TaxID=186801 RepID=UPI001651B923
MKKKMTLRIIVGMLTIILIVTGILPFMTNKTLAAENVLSDNIILVTENEVSDTAKDGYSKVTFKIGDQTKDVYIKNGNTVKLKSSNKNYGVIAGGIENGEAITENTVIYAKSYSYQGTLYLEKSIQSETPDENGYYTLQFSAKSQNLPSIKSENQNVILVLDRSFSMACSVDEDVDSDAMAPTYEKTRWSVTINAVEKFLDEFLSEGTSNKVSVISYCGSARTEITRTSSKNDIMSKLNLIYNEEMYNNDYKSYYKRNDVTKIGRGLGSATNIQQGLKQVSEIAGDTTGASVILFTDGGANRYDNGEIGGYYYIKNNNEINRYNKPRDEVNGSYYAGKAGEELKAAGADIYTIVLMSKESDITDLVKVSLGNKSLNYEKSWGKTYFTFSDGGYAKEFYTAANAEQLNNRFKQIMTEMTSLPFETSSVTDTLDKHFVLVAGQENVTDNKDGTFTVKYPEKISATEQTVTVKIKAKDGYTGYSYTNDGCQFDGTIDGLSYMQQFEETPAAVILPHAVDDEYTVNQNETLNAQTVLINDGNEIVNNPKKNLTLKTAMEKTVQNGKIKFNEDGTFEYIPDKDFSGKDIFVYKVVLTVDGKEYTKSAKVTINVIPKQPETPTEPETPNADGNTDRAGDTNRAGN